MTWEVLPHPLFIKYVTSGQCQLNRKNCTRFLGTQHFKKSSFTFKLTSTLWDKSLEMWQWMKVMNRHKSKLWMALMSCAKYFHFGYKMSHCATHGSLSFGSRFTPLSSDLISQSLNWLAYHFLQLKCQVVLVWIRNVKSVFIKNLHSEGSAWKIVM